MGNVNVVLEDGKVVSVDEEAYKLAQGQVGAPHQQTAGASISQMLEDQRREKAAGAAGTATAFVTGALDTATFGLAGKALDAYDPEGGQYTRDARQQHPIANFAGSVAGFAIPGAAGISAAAGKAVGGATGVASVGRAVEGGMLGAGGHVAHTNVTGDPLSIEGMRNDVGIGAFLNVGLGLMADRFRSIKGKSAAGQDSRDLAWESVRSGEGGPLSLLNGAEGKPLSEAARARKAYDVWEAGSQATDDAAGQVAASDVAEAAKVTQKAAKEASRVAKEQVRAQAKAINENPLYSGVQDAHKSSVAGIKAGNKVIEDQQAAYDEFISPRGQQAAVKSFESVQSRLRVARTELAKLAKLEGAADDGAVALSETPAPAGLPSRAGTSGYTPTSPATVIEGGLPARAGTSGYKPVGRPITPSIEETFKAAKKLKDAGDLEGARKVISDYEASLYGKVESAPTPLVTSTKGLPTRARTRGYKPKVGEPAPTPAVEAVVPPPKAPSPGAILRKKMDETLMEMSVAKQKAREFIKAGDVDGMTGALEGAQDAVREWMPEAVIEFPRRPFDALREVPPDMPRNLLSLGKMRNDTVVRLANSLDDTTVSQLDQLAVDIGLMPGATPADTLLGLHKQIRDTFYLPNKAATAAAEEVVPFAELDDLLPTRPPLPQEKWSAARNEVDAARAGGGYKESKWYEPGEAPVASAGKTGSLLDTPISIAKTGGRIAAFRAANNAFGGGTVGAILGVAAGHATGGMFGVVEGIVSGAALSGKAGLRAKLGEAFARFAQPVGNALETLGPVSASLTASFPRGVPDDREDARDLTVSRSREVNQMLYSAPDTMYNMVRGFMGVGGDIAPKLHQKMLGSLQYLNDVAPKDPGTEMTMTGSKWKPGYTEADTYAHQYQAVLHPEVYIARVLAGDGHYAGVEALAATSPATLEEARNIAMQQDWKDLTLAGHRGLSMLFQRPMSALQDPDVFWLIQGQQIPQPPEQAQQNTRPPTGNPAGRAPAVNVRLAGSSVANLTNQG